MMKKILLILIFAITGLQAQEKKHEKIKALKTAYITEKLSLSASEAEKFWPIYNNYAEKFHDLKVSEHKEIYGKLKNNFDSLSDAEANELINMDLDLELKELELKRQLTVDLRQIISPRKIINLKKAENDFKRELLQRYRSGKGKEKRQ